MAIDARGAAAVQDREAALHVVVDEIASVLEHAGLSPLPSRLVARLVTCTPAEQSSADLAAYCHASKGAISTATRMLMQTGIIERVRMRGSRAAWFRIAPNAWTRYFHGEMRRTKLVGQLAARALQLTVDRPASERARLQEFHDLYLFLDEEFPALLQRWESSRRKS